MVGDFQDGLLLEMGICTDTSDKSSASNLVPGIADCSGL